MKTIELKAWGDFAGAIEWVRKQWNTILFRGQADEGWPLSTTLERRVNRPLHIIEYLERAIRVQSEIESYTGVRWNNARFPELEGEIEARSGSSFIHLPAYDYLVYLRHYGFPSPLLDWTKSSYIAAYFAYIEPSKNNRAVFCFVDNTDGSKGAVEGDALITQHGPYVTTDKRHFAQKAWYTTCTKRDGSTKHYYFCPHEEAFARDDPTQDVLIKFVLPANDRIAALRSLNEYNINHFTLFQSEDSLVQAIASRVFDVDDG